MDFNLNTVFLIIIFIGMAVLFFKLGKARLGEIINISQYIKARNIIKSMLFVPQAIVTIDESGKIVYTNNRSKTGFGWTEDEMVGKTMKLVIPEKYFASYDLFKSNHSSENDQTHLELECARKDGSLFPVDVMIGRWTDDNDEKNVFFTIVIRNISHKKINESTVKKAIDELKRVHNLLINSNKLLHSGSWSWEMSPDFVDTGEGLKAVPDNVECDPGFRVIFGLKSDEKITAIDLMSKVYHRDRPGVNKRIVQCMNDKQVYDIQYRITQPSDVLDLIRCIGKPEVSRNGKLIKINGAVILVKKNVPRDKDDTQ